jgi:hypothetical protein
MRNLFLIAAVLALASGAACKKSENKPAEPAKDAAAATPPTPTPTVDAAPVPSADAAKSADATPAAADAPAAAPADAAKADADPLKSICPQVLAKIVECKEDKEFEKALKEGADAKEQKKIGKLIAGISEWPSVSPCANLAASYEFEGFIDKWDQLKDPAILESCAKLGAAVKAAGGLFGGDAAM